MRWAELVETELDLHGIWLLGVPSRGALKALSSHPYVDMNLVRSSKMSLTTWSRLLFLAWT